MCGSAFNPSKCTQTAVRSEQTHTHPEQWAANPTVPGEQFGVRFLLKGLTSVVVLKVEEGAVHSLPPPTIPARPGTRTRDLWVTSPTLYPLGHDCRI